jgi:hypothetical protein
MSTLKHMVVVRHCVVEAWWSLDQGLKYFLIALGLDNDCFRSNNSLSICALVLVPHRTVKRGRKLGEVHFFEPRE